MGVAVVIEDVGAMSFIIDLFVGLHNKGLGLDSVLVLYFDKATVNV
jgi:hypothetical protein